MSRISLDTSTLAEFSKVHMPHAKISNLNKKKEGGVEEKAEAKEQPDPAKKQPNTDKPPTTMTTGEQPPRQNNMS